MRTHSLLSLALSVAATVAAAQPADSKYAGDVPMQEYLALVGQVAPAARDGAEQYAAAFGQRCGRPIRVAEMRAAFAEGAGDPVLMGMIRASFARDLGALSQLRASLVCPRN